jgi:Na+/proline symporter/signal transduction histidine kinase/ActR/RegA family two-component response regulator
MQGWGIVFAAIAYLLFLFVVASYGDRRLARTRDGATRPSRSAIYALSLAIYCTSWTFFGSVGLASKSGLDFLAIYLGPILMITVGARLFGHIVSVAKKERITSIADFIASRYGKSASVGAFASVIAVLGTVPYIALQLKAISTTVDTMIVRFEPSVLGLSGAPVDTSFFVSVLLALFAILFGTRNTDATERHDGLMLAVATESIVKLVAFLAVGLYATFYLFGGIGDLVEQAQQSPFVSSTFFGGIHPSRFLVFTLLSFGAFVLLPRQFHVGVVENHSTHELKTARWMFPLYLILINLFVIPVAIAGMLTFGSSVDADTYVLALPLENDAWIISFLVFVGGLSAATAMVIVACVALAIMISNNLVLPLFLRLEGENRGFGLGGRTDMSDKLLIIRRTAIFCILALAYAYFQALGNSAALASIGLLSFAALAQFAPAFFIGLFWRRPTSSGALWGMGTGFAVWFYTLFLPTILEPNSALLLNGPQGIEWLRPQALFGFEAEPLNHGVLFSLLANTLAFVAISYLRKPLAIERMQASAFSIRGKTADATLERGGRTVTVAELKHTVASYLGAERAKRAFETYYSQHGRELSNRDLADDDLISHAEQLLASAIGAASSRLVMSLLLQRNAPSEESTIRLLGDASEALQYNRDLLQTALDQVEQGISVFDAEFGLSSWNRQFRVLLDLPPEMGQAGTPLSILCDAISSNLKGPQVAPEALVKQLLETRQTSTITLGRSNQIIEIQTNALPNGGLVISWNDTTEKANAARALTVANETLEKRVRERTEELTRLNEDLAKARESAEAANIGKTKFLAAVGHDILQPLNAARLYTSSLVEALDGDPSQKLAGNVDDSLESVEDILGAVLAISRLDAGALTPNFTVFPISRLLDRLEVEFQPIAMTKGLKLQVRHNDFSVRSDYSLLRRLLQNLISNAIKYTANGSVVIDASVRRSMIVIEVRDTGIGILAADRESIFQEFHRLEQGKKVAPGLGLGLSIVKRLASTLNHELEVITEPGKGSNFRVFLPLAVSEQTQIDSKGEVTIPNFDVSNLVVICVDNDDAILDGMNTLMSRWGCQVHLFAGSAELRPKIDSIKPDIVLADYHLDRENGLEVIAMARAAIKLDLPAILITADRSAVVRDAARALDITVMNKPLKPAALRALFARLINRTSKSTAAE